MTDREKPPRALVVDDDASIRLLVQRALQRHGFETDAAADGVEALEKLQADPYDLLILDLMMPRLSGGDVVEQLSRKSEPMPKILVMTAAAPTVLSDFPVNRVQKIFTKPFELQSLVSSAIDVASRDSDQEPPNETGDE